jgi:hypothetical protein
MPRENKSRYQAILYLIAYGHGVHDIQKTLKISKQVCYYYIKKAILKGHIEKLFNGFYRITEEGKKYITWGNGEDFLVDMCHHVSLRYLFVRGPCRRPPVSWRVYRPLGGRWVGYVGRVKGCTVLVTPRSVIIYGPLIRCRDPLVAEIRGVARIHEVAKIVEGLLGCRFADPLPNGRPHHGFKDPAATEAVLSGLEYSSQDLDVNNSQTLSGEKEYKNWVLGNRDFQERLDKFFHIDAIVDDIYRHLKEMSRSIKLLAESQRDTAERLNELISLFKPVQPSGDKDLNPEVGFYG